MKLTKVYSNLQNQLATVLAKLRLYRYLLKNQRLKHNMKHNRTSLPDLTIRGSSEQKR